MNSEIDFFLNFPFISLWELLIPGGGQLGPQGLDWQDLCWEPLDIATYIVSKEENGI